jgi:hypothetical protein
MTIAAERDDCLPPRNAKWFLRVGSLQDGGTDPDEPDRTGYFEFFF